MNKYDKKIVMFFRGREDSAKVVGSTENIINFQNLSKYIDIEFINLDKRNFKKYFDKLEVIPNIIYVWHDEEILSDYIKETYPKVEIRTYNLTDSREFKGEHNYDGSKRIKYTKIGNDIIEEYIKTLGTRELWTTIDTDYNYEIKKEAMYEYEYNKIPEYKKKKYYKTEEEAKTELKSQLEIKIKENEAQVKYYQKKVKEFKNKLKKFEEE